MKRIALLSMLVSIGLSHGAFTQEDSTGMPGDNFDLEGALYLFKHAKSLEDFEKQLNTESNLVNNLDLDQDGSIDYIRVIDNSKDRSHAIQLQVAVSSTESQDIAAILIESDKDGDAKLQMVGDKSLYGEEKIIDPLEEKEEKSSGRPASYVGPTTWVYVNVWAWPCVTYMYAPSYVVWVSPYYYRYYPVWWHPWHPVYYRVHYRRVHHYHGWCNYSTVYYVPNAHNVYTVHYKQSPTIYKKYETPRNNFGHKSANSPQTGKPVRTKTAVQGEKIGSPSTNRGTSSDPKNNQERQVKQPTQGASTGGNTSSSQGSTGKTKPAQRPVKSQTQPKQNQRPQPRQQPVRQHPVPRTQPRPSNGGGGKGGRR